MPDDRARDVEVARERVQRLLGLAEEAALEDRLEDARRYGAMAWRLTTRHTLDAPDRLKARVCRSCHAFWLPGETARVRVTGGKVSTTCTACGNVRRVPFTDERKARRSSAGSPDDA